MVQCSGWWFGTMEWIMNFHWEYIMIPTDYHSYFFRGVGIPPTRIMSYNPHEKNRANVDHNPSIAIYKWVWLKSIRDL